MGVRDLKRLLAIAIGLGVLAAGCTKVGGGGQGGRANSFTVPHVLRFTTTGDINTINPHLGQFTPIGMMGSLAMAWLIKWDQHNEPVPELATVVPTKANGGVSKDGLTITYHLRKGVKWSDGAPFSADDVAFSISAVLNPANNEVGRSGWDQIAKVDEPDKYTVVIHLRKPYSPFVETFFSTAGANPCILPKHILGGLPNINNAPYNSKPVGIGPFKFDRWDRAQRVVLVANPLYFRGRPKLDKIIFEIIPDRNTALAQLEAKEIDMWYQVPGAFFVKTKDLSAYSYLRTPSYYFNHIDFNVSRPKVADPVVRQAIRLATDRATIREKIGRGVGILQEEPAPNVAPYYDPTIKMVPFDIAQANALLDKAGWVRGPDGIRSKNGVKLNLDLATASGAADTDNQIELLRSWWQQIGVSLSIRHYPTQLLFAPLEQGGIVYSKDKWDVVLFAWGVGAVGDFSSLYSCRLMPPAGQNDIRWCNKTAQAAMDKLYADYEQPARNQDDSIVMHQLIADAPTIVTLMREDITEYNSDLKNFHPNQVTPFDDMMNVDI
jgi:peptide/nickel transport system substrate-binding protein